MIAALQISKLTLLGHLASIRRIILLWIALFIQSVYGLLWSDAQSVA